MAGVTIKVDVRKATQSLSALARRQIPFATAQAVNDVAFQVMRAENAAMAQTFKHPGRWTSTAVQVERKARKGSPTAIVSIRPGRAYLTPYETGGVHVLTPSKASSGGTLLNPKAVQLNASGQFKRGTLASLMARGDVFKAEIHGVRGIWLRLPKGNPLSKRMRAKGYKQQQVRLLIRFGDALPVKQQLHFGDRAAEVARTQMSTAFHAALTKAIATAK